MPVDKAHVRELAKLIDQEAKLRPGTGQQIPVLLADVPDYDRLPILDGFHRVPALELLHRDTVFARIRPDTSWEEVVNQRITAATSHREVRFSRIVEWVEEAWEFHPLSHKIKGWQAFSFKNSNQMTGKNLGLTLDEVDEVKDWVDRKCEQWQIGPATIHNFLRLASEAAPELVRSVRERKSGHKLEALTQQHLAAVVKELPNLHEIQLEVAEVAKQQALSVSQTALLARAAVKAGSPEQVRAFANSDVWKEAIAAGARIASMPRSGAVFSEGQEREYIAELAGFKHHVELLRKLKFATTIKEASDIVMASLQALNEVHAVQRIKGELVFNEGEPVTGLVLLRNGSVILSNTDSYNGAELARLVDGFHIIGNEALSGGNAYNSSARAFGSSDIQFIPVDMLQTLIQKEPRLMPFLLVSQAIQIDEDERRIRDFALKTVQQRLAKTLIDLAQRDDAMVHDHITQALIAQLSGCARESANKQIGDFERKGYLLWGGHLGPQFIDTRKLQLIYDANFS